MKQDIQRIMLAAAKPLFSYFHSLYAQDCRGRDALGSLSLGDISYGKTWSFRYSDSSVDTQWIQSFIG